MSECGSFCSWILDVGGYLGFGSWGLGFLRRRLISRALVILCSFGPIHAFAAEVLPSKPEAYFNDYAGVVSKEAASRFNQELAQFERETSNQVVVAVFPKMESEDDVAAYTQRVAQSWGVGQRDKRNGVVLFVFTQDRKMYIQVGYGLEGALPDLTGFDITEYRIKPHFRNNDYEGGLAEGIDSIFKAIRGEYKGTGKTDLEKRGTARPGFNVALFFFFVVALMIISRLMRAMGGYSYSSRRSGPVFVPMSFGGGGGGWSSGDSGGGFSGFSGGGGSFGGGGAGSSW
jgi:uncharacterized protein